MITQVINNSTKAESVRRLVRKHHFQIRSGSQDPELAQLCAITFQPCGQSKSFLGNSLQRIGTATMVVWRYEVQEHTDRLQLLLRGYRAEARRDGSVIYGGPGNCRFHYDGSRLARPNSRGPFLSPSRNPGLVRLLLQLDEACKSHLERGAFDRTVPTLPRIWLGFAPSEPPRFEDSLALRRLAAQELGVPMERLGANGDCILQKYLEDLWQRQWLQPHTSANPADKLLVDAEFCSQAGRALEIFEDFSELLGAPIWNVARDVELLQVANPARTVLRRYAVDTTQNFDQEFSDQQLLQLENAMRKAIGPLHVNFTQEEIFDGLTNPSGPLVAAEAGLPQLRAKLARHISECVTDRDLLTAARAPCRPLYATGACVAQVVVKPDIRNRSTLEFCSEQLERRAHVTLNV